MSRVGLGLSQVGSSKACVKLVELDLAQTKLVSIQVRPNLSEAKLKPTC